MIKVDYITHSGDDLLVVNAARVSFDKTKDEFDSTDEKLIKFLSRSGHFSPFTHPQITIRVTAPIFVARQAFRHTVGLTINEVSRRYVTFEPTMFHPDYWRERHPNKKQGSIQGKEHPQNKFIEQRVNLLYNAAVGLYNELLALNVAPEQARMVLPQAMLSSWIWTGSLAAFARIYNLRIKEDAQVEIQNMVKEIEKVIRPLFPISWGALTGVE